LRELEGEAFARYDCWRCGGRGHTAQPTSVIVLGYRATAVVKLAHAGCAASQIIAFDADRPSALEAAGFADMHSKAALLEYASPPRYRSLLVLEPRVEMAETGPGGERVNLLISGMLEAGLTLMRTGGQMPGPAKGWRLDLSGRESAQLANARGGTVFEGQCELPGDWLEVAGEVGGCVVLIGTVGLYALSDQDMSVGRFHQMLNTAARAGVLAGGLVAI
jgi:hypothetical protein